MATNTHPDAFIIGGGHNGLICAAYLAKAGKKPLVLERRHIVGSACVTEEIWPGYQVSTAAYVMSSKADLLEEKERVSEEFVATMPASGTGGPTSG